MKVYFIARDTNGKMIIQTWARDEGACEALLRKYLTICSEKKVVKIIEI